MLRRKTTHEARLGPPPGSAALVAMWNLSLVNNLLALVWSAYDELHSATWSQVDWTQDYDDEERSLTEELERAIHKASDGFLPVSIQHGSFERESRKSAPAQSPEYDIAFVWIDDARIIWPVEAKMLDSDNDTNANFGDYIKTVQDRYLTCYYAPFSNSGAMLGYLKSGDPETVTKHIAKRMGCTLEAVKYTLGSDGIISSRCHKTSDHVRVVPAGKDYPANFRLHHLIMPLQKNQPAPATEPPAPEAPDTPVSTAPPAQSLSPSLDW